MCGTPRHSENEALLLLPVGIFVRMESIDPLGNEGGLREMGNGFAETGALDQQLTTGLAGERAFAPGSDLSHDMAFVRKRCYFLASIGQTPSMICRSLSCAKLSMKR